MSQQLERIRYIAKNYSLLQGLSLANVGLFSIFLGAFNLFSRLLFDPMTSSWNPWLTQAISVAAILIVFGLTFLLNRWITHYYTRRFGYATASQEVSNRSNNLSIGLIGLLIVGMVLDARIHLSVSIVGIFVALALVIHWWLMERKLHHYLSLALLTLLISVAPAFIPALSQTLDNPKLYSTLFSIITGCIVVIAGLLDHWRLTRYMTSL